MQKIIIFFGLFYTTISLFAQDFSLNIQNGTAVGELTFGNPIHVFSNKAAANQVFKNWTGNGSVYLTFADEWHSILMVNETDNVTALELVAEYDQLPLAAVQTTEMINLFGLEDGVFMNNIAKEVNFIIPENPKGIVFLFHGTGGSGANLFERYETSTLIKDLYFAGYGCISTDANERTLGDQNGDGKIRWVTSPPVIQEIDNNVELFFINALRDTFINRYGLTNDFPFFSYGVSNGANFADLAAAALGFKASAHMVGNGNPPLYHQRDDLRPVIWLQAINDQNQSADSTVARANYQAVLDAGICTEWYWLDFSPIYEKRFKRSLNQITNQQSQAIFDRFYDYEGLVNDNNSLTITDLFDLPDDFFSPLGLTNAQESDVINQLKVINADHGGHGDYNKRILTFFDNECITTSTHFILNEHTDTQVFPNPAKNKVTVKTDIKEVQSIIIYDVKGAVYTHLKTASSNNQWTIEANNWPDGVYFVHVQTDQSVHTVSLVIQK